MAISKNRLEELIKEGATIYSKSGLSYSLINPYTYTIMDGTLYQVIGTKQISTCPIEKLENLYETKEQAEWALNYHATRTEELDLPYWTDIVEHKDDDIYKITSFRTKNGNIYNLLFKKGDLIMWNVQELRVIWVDLATKENYTKLCDLCLKLFKGEE